MAYKEVPWLLSNRQGDYISGLEASPGRS